MVARSPSQTYFLPGDWVLNHRPSGLVATKLSTGELVTVEGSMADSVVANELRASTWSALEQHEPLLGELRDQLGAHPLAPLDRATLLRGAGWRQLFIELTARCNERCVHCYAESSPEREESLDLAELRALLDDAKSLRFEVVQLTGGDPLISPHCIPAAEYAHGIGIPKLEVYTNGLALRGEVYEHLRRLGVSFAFSLYSHDAARHDAITRTPGSHRRTTRAIRRALEDGLSVRTGTVIMEQNEGDADATRDYLAKLGVDPSAIGVGQSRAVGRGDLHDIGKCKTDPAPPRAGSIERHGDPLAEARPFGGTAAVSYDGEVYPCIFSRHLALGSIRDQSLRAILNAPEPVAAPTENLLTERAHWARQLACWECQTRSSMLGAAVDA
jgi:MoaA/NifB/PqqE/SkfB family radical SAM enzyme